VYYKFGSNTATHLGTGNSAILACEKPVKYGYTQDRTYGKSIFETDGSEFVPKGSETGARMLESLKGD
jgi:hypothetical protein